MKSLWRICRLANAATWSIMFFAVGVLAGVMLIAMLPGMPWASTMLDIAPELAAEKPIETLDLGAQRSMAAAAWWMVAGTLLSTMVSVAALVMLSRTLNETRRTNDISMIVGKNQTRAYVGAVSGELKVFNGTVAVLSMVLKNAGQSPARGVVIDITMQVYGFDDQPWRPRLTESYRASGADIGAGETGHAGTVLFDITQERLLERLDPEEPGKISFWLRISYRDVFDDKHNEVVFLGTVYSRRKTDFDKPIQLVRTSEP